jgi:uncharacterized protein (DUF1697 family)
LAAWVALLRAVNLGSRNKVPMAELRRVFEQAGCESVSTYIQSGNVLFEHAKPDRAALERAVAREFGVQTVIVLRRVSQLAKLVAAHPFGKDTSKSAVAFLAEKPGRAEVTAMARLDIAPDRFEVVGPDIALHYPNGFQGAKLTPAKLEKALGVRATARNWRTVAKLAEGKRPSDVEDDRDGPVVDEPVIGGPSVRKLPLNF